MADQALSSLTNFALSLLVARSVGIRDLGAFALAFATYLVVVGATRAIITEPLLIRYATAPDERWRTASGAATWLAGLIGVTAAAVLLVVALATSATMSTAFLALAVTLPGLVVQDAWRYVFFAGGRGSKAFVNDLVWAILLVPSVTFVIATDRSSVGWFVLAWGTSATVAAAAGVAQAGFRPTPRSPRAWWRAHRDLSGRLLGEFATWSGAAHLSTYGIAAASSVAAVGALRAADVLLGPLNILQTGMGLVLVPEGVRVLEQSRDKLRSMVRLVSLAIAGAAAALGLALVLLPDRLGELLLASSWDDARAILLPWAVVRGVSGVIAAAGFGLRSLAATKRSLRSRLVGDLLYVVAGIAGAVAGGARGAAVGMAIGACIGAGIWMVQFERALEEHPAPSG